MGLLMADFGYDSFVGACLAGSPDNATAFLSRLDQVIADVVAPAATAVDQDAAHPRLSLDALTDIGVTGVLVPAEYGGLGYGSALAALVVERVAHACASTAAILMFHYQVVNRTLDFASPARREDDLVAFAKGALAASAWTEPGTTRDKGNLRTSLTDSGPGLVVDGAKTFCTGLRSAAVIDVLLSARLDGAAGPTFVRVDSSNAGAEIAEVYPMLGLRGTGTGTLRLRSVPVTRADVLHGVGTGRTLMTRNHQAPLNPGLLALGIAAAAFDAARGLCAGQAPGVPARDGSPAVRAALAETAVQLEATYAYAAALIREMTAAPERAYVSAGKLKVQATRTAETVTRRLLPAVGSSGFLAAFPLERYLRDAQATALMGPANELCLDRVAADVLPAITQTPEGTPCR
jgi:alkylation response protein AidB-like acyl-CoA dehydrogenase